MPPEELREMSLDTLCQRLAFGASEVFKDSARVEIVRRQTESQLLATEAQRRAAEAAALSAEYATRNAQHVFMAIVALVITAIVQVAISIAAWRFPIH